MEQLRELGAFGIDNRFYLLIFYGKHGRKIQKKGKKRQKGNEASGKVIEYLKPIT